MDIKNNIFKDEFKLLFYYEDIKIVSLKLLTSPACVVTSNWWLVAID